jgi:RimJ/RimL family protein N-acetyltransferase
MHGKQMIGSAEIALNDGVLAHVGGLGISLAEGWREMGLGTILMRVLIESAETHLAGLRIIQLDVFANNERGRRLYQRLGFTEYARLPGAVLHRGQYVDLISMYRPVGTG